MTEDNHDENKLIAQRREKLTAIREAEGGVSQWLSSKNIRRRF